MDTKLRKISRFFPKPARVTAFVLACVTAGIALCSDRYQQYSRPVMWSADYDNSVEMNYIASENYRSQLADMYEQLCILGVVELAGSDKNMNYVGNRYLMSDFLYYMDYNQYKYKKTDNGVLPVSDLFDYYVSYTRPAVDVIEAEVPDEEATDAETTAAESPAEDRSENSESAEEQTGEAQTVFVTNIAELNSYTTDTERLMYLQNRFCDYILRSNDVVSSDMTSSGHMFEYSYETADSKKKVVWANENYPNNFLPLGGWFYDNYGRYIYNFGNDETIRFYAYPSGTEEGEKARQEYVEVKLPLSLREHDDELYEYNYEYEIDENEESYFTEVPLEQMADYEAYEGETAGLTVFIAPKSGLMEEYAGDYNTMRHCYGTSAITRCLTFLLVIYLLAAAAVSGLCREDAGESVKSIPFELFVIAFLLIWWLIADVFEWYYTDLTEFSLWMTGSTVLGYMLYSIAGGLLAGAELLVGTHIVKSIFGRRVKLNLIAPKLWRKLMAKYRTTAMYKKRRQLPVGQKLKRRSLTVLGAFAATLFILFFVMCFDVWALEGLVFVAGALAVLTFIVTEVKNLLLSRELGKLDRRIAALKHNEQFTEKVSENSDIYGDVMTLDNISDTIREAVENQIKSERMKIELVANVSHDLKTPLTSIISYIDLLNKTELSDEARDYVQILDKKSQKLKSIVADVFSLAKATSGIEVNMEELDFVTLFNQSYADSEDKVKQSGKIVKVMVREQTAPIIGDGSKLYRVFQNIIDNALKYSMEGSRIFLDVERREDNIVFTAKNISSYPIDFTADEITERFVRGDKSRTDGGSGLGLSIAKSFTEACGGRFAVELDGDMFKAVIAMPIREKKESSVQETEKKEN